MADDWEENDWESESFTPQLPAVTAAAAAKPTSTLAADVDMSKFQDEDAEVEEKIHAVPASQVGRSVDPERGGARPARLYKRCRGQTRQRIAATKSIECP